MSTPHAERPDTYPGDGAPVTPLAPVIRIDSRPLSRQEKRERKKLRKQRIAEKKHHEKEKAALKKAEEHHLKAGKS